MTTSRASALAVWAAIGVVWAASIAAWIIPIPLQPSQTLGASGSPAAPITFDTTTIRTSAALIRDRDAFRLERRPAQVRYNPWEPPSAVVTLAQPTPRPVLALVGILGGPPWFAVIEGIPGRETGVLLRTGEDAAGIRLLRIKGDTAFLRGLDTTWVLTSKRVWQ